MNYSKSRNELKNKTPPSYLAETAFITTLLFFFKFYSLNAFATLTFVTVLLPFMIYHVLSMFGAILNFVTSLHVESESEDLVSPL
jgi:fatty acid desaturase